MCLQPGSVVAALLMQLHQILQSSCSMQIRCNAQPVRKRSAWILHSTLQDVHASALTAELPTSASLVKTPHTRKKTVPFPSISMLSCTFLPVVQYAIEVVVQMPLMGINAQLPSHSFQGRQRPVC